MKNTILALALLVASNSAFAQDIRIHVGGRGLHVCALEQSLTHRISLGRGLSDAEAAERAKNECIRHNEKETQSIFCDKVVSCDVDANEKNANIDIQFSVSRVQGRINITFENEGPAQMCSSVNKLTDVVFVAAVPTRTEAIAATRNLCLDANENQSQSIFCSDVADMKCEPAQLINSNIGMGDDPERSILELMEKILR